MITGRADCGLQYAVRRSGNAVGYCSLTIKCGTRDEEGFHSGIAHFTEHTIFKGTAHKSARVINNNLDRLGGELNAFTTKEEIVLHATVLKEDLSKAASLLLELATCPVFPEEEVEIERGVVIEEISSSKDAPADDIYDQFEGALFEGHPLGRSILGTAGSVRKISCKELAKFVREHFTPENMVLAVVADIPEKKMETSVLRLAGKVFDGSASESVPREIRPVGRIPVFHKRIDKKNHEVNAVIGSTAPSLFDGQDRIATVLLNNIIGGPASNSLLNDLLREKNGWVYGVESSYSQYTEAGILAISLGCDRCNLDKCLDAVGKVVARMKETPLSDSTLKAAKKQLLGQLAISSDNGETQCLSMGKSMLTFGRIWSDEENVAAIESVTAGKVQELACRIFMQDKVSSLVFL